MTYQAHKARNKEIEYVINDNGCHICTSHSKNPKGYPQIQRYKKPWVISRYLYTQKYGEIPERMVVRHKCDNPSCINIEHLELGSQQENMNDMVERGRSLKGINYKGGKDIPNLKILRLQKGLLQKELAEQIGVDPSFISLVENGKSKTTLEIYNKIMNILDGDYIV